MIKEFKEFAMKGNMLEMAVGIIIGASFSGVVNSLVNDVLMPPIGLLLGGADFAELFAVLQAGDPGGPYATLALAKEAGAVTLNYGMFINTLINFLVVAVSLFLVIRTMNRLRKEEESAEE
ncbi:MAG TPA: large conductance mechanosensitive channel protein MscL [Anaerolineales bacterium]|jgi:large conductance mechanosensitive channel|nr:large conductance mechanosensitive channel protein MscL [Anaerolineales bacterium]